MPKVVKIALAVVLPLLLIVGIAYGLAKIGVIPVAKFAAKNKALGTVLTKVGLNKKVPTKRIAVASAAVVDPLADEKKALTAQRNALEEEKAALISQQEAKQREQAKAEVAAQNAIPDPKNVARMATVYEQMEPDAVNKIFAKMPDDQVIALMRRMDEKPVAQILATVTPERAARLTLALSRPAPVPPDQTASN